MLRTDHSSLQWLYTFKEPEGQIARWLEKLQEFDFGVVHRSGRNHGNAAALSSSRLPLEQDVNVNTLLGLVVSERSMQQLQLQDKSIGPVYQAMQDGSKPGPETIQAGSRELLQLIGQWDQLTLKDGVLYRQHENANGHMKFQVILPEGSAKVTPSTVDQLPAGTNVKFSESEEDMAVDVPQETDVADRGQRADGEPQLEGAIEVVPHEEPQLHELHENRIPGPVEIVPDIDHLIIMERYHTEGGSSVVNGRHLHNALLCIPVSPDLPALKGSNTNTSRYEQLALNFEAKYGRKPTFVARAPRRVKIIGEHMDYCGYMVLPMAIEQGLAIACVHSHTPTISFTTSPQTTPSHD
eukprot:Em0001g1788a